MKNDLDVFYIPEIGSFPTFIDIVKVREDGVLLGFYSKQSKDEMEQKYKKQMLVGKFGSLSEKMEDSLCTEPQSISEHNWEEVLCAFHPKDWMYVNGVESFKCREYFWGQMANIYVRSSKGFFTFKNRASMTAEEIAEKINTYNSSQSQGGHADFYPSFGHEDIPF